MCQERKSEDIPALADENPHSFIYAPYTTGHDEA